MGTNYYTIEEANLYREGAHIGKSSMAGLFCWDCKLTLNAGGKEGVHTGRFLTLPACPQCGKTYEGDLHDPESKTLRPSGVGAVYSFTWAVEPVAFKQLCALNPLKHFIIDEYGGTFHGTEFLDRFSFLYGIEFTHSIGQEFL